MSDTKEPVMLLAGINIETLQKGDVFTSDQVEHAYRVLDDKFEENLERFKRGELKADPTAFAPTNLIKHIEKVRLEMGEPVVCRSQSGGIRILHDSEAVAYLDSQANAGLRKHRAKTGQMFTSIDRGSLNDHEARQLETNQRKHAFVLAAHQGARTQSLKMQRKGLELPNYKGQAG
jgi:hypothetical protein